jgi:hypothetical protein
MKDCILWQNQHIKSYLTRFISNFLSLSVKHADVDNKITVIELIRS